MFFLGPTIPSGIHTAFSCHVLLASPGLQQVLRFSLFSMTLTVWHFVECPSVGVWCFSQGWAASMGFGEEDHKGRVAILTPSCPRHMWPSWLFTDDTNLGHLAEVSLTSSSFAYRRLGSVTHTQEEGVKLYLFEEEYLHRHLEFYVGDLSVSPIYLSVINNQE